MKSFDYHNSYSQEKVDSREVDSKLLKRLWTYLRPYWGWMVLAILLLIVAKVIEAAVPILIGRLSQMVMNNASSGSLPLSSITEQGMKIAGLLAFSYVFDVLNVLIRSWIGQKAIFSLRVEVFEHIQKLPIKTFDFNPVGRLMTRAIHDVDQINQMFAESLVPIIGSCFLFISMFVGIVVLNWQLGILFALLLPVGLILTNNFRIDQRHCYELIRAIISAMNTFVQEHLAGIFTIRNFGLLKKEKQHFEKINEDHCTAYLQSIKQFSFFIGSIDFLQSFSLIAVFFILFHFPLDGKDFEAGTFVTLSLYVLMFFRPLADLAERYNVLQSALAASERIFDIIDQKLEPYQQKSLLKLKEVKTIEFKDVWFAYDKKDWVLQGLNFSIKKGESLAIVGITGAGKSTILKLLMRFYEVNQGSIKINGHAIHEYSLKDLRKQFCVVLQDPVIFSGSLYHNISLFQPEITEEQADKVLDYLNLKAFVSRFPNGLNENLTERGKSLSVGETQLISMARAIAHDHSVLMLDEATANIDSSTEKLIQEALKKIIRTKTSLIIAHRLSTIRDVDRIIVIAAGKVAEMGNHQELLHQKGIYEKLYRLQFH